MGFIPEADQISFPFECTCCQQSGFHKTRDILNESTQRSKSAVLIPEKSLSVTSKWEEIWFQTSLLRQTNMHGTNGIALPKLFLCLYKVIYNNMPNYKLMSNTIS